MSANGQEPVAPEATEPSAPEAAPAAPDQGLERLFARMDEMAGQVSGIVQRVDGITQLVTPPEEEPEFYDDTGGLTEDGARALIQGIVDERVSETLAPREQARMIERRDEEYDALRERYPALDDPETANRVLQSAIRWANAVGHPEIIDRPEFVEIIEDRYIRERYDTLAESEADQPRSVVLESGQGAARQQQQANEPDWSQRITDAASRLRPQI
jgi:hypothetical protein